MKCNTKLYLEHTKDTTKEKELSYNNATGYKINLQKFIAFLYENNRRKRSAH